MTTRPHIVDPPTIPPEMPVEAFVSKSASLLHDYTFPTREIDTVLAILHEARATGQLTVDFSQGGIGRVRFRQEEKITPP